MYYYWCNIVWLFFNNLLSASKLFNTQQHTRMTSTCATTSYNYFSTLYDRKIIYFVHLLKMSVSNTYRFGNVQYFGTKNVTTTDMQMLQKCIFY